MAELSLRVAMMRVQAKIVCLLLLELAALDSVVTLLVANIPVFGLLLYLLGGKIAVWPVVCYFAVIAILMAAGFFRLLPSQPSGEDALCLPLSAYPKVAKVCELVASRAGLPVPRELLVAFSPSPWRSVAPDLDLAWRRRRGSVPVPLLCLGVWSVMEFQAHVARYLFKRRGPRRLLDLSESAMHRLRAEKSLSRESLQGQSPRARLVARFVTWHSAALTEWRFLADLEADRSSCRLFDPGVLASLVYKSEVIEKTGPWFQQSMIEPALEQGVLLPAADSCAAYFAAIDPNCREQLSKWLNDLNRAVEPAATPFSVRLSALHAAAGSYAADPRMASSLFENLPGLEWQVAAHEFGRERVARAAVIPVRDALTRFVIPEMEQEVRRNEALVNGKTRFDVPDLLARKELLAADYRGNPNRLLAPVQRAGRITHLLGSLTALEMMREGWVASFEFGEGVLLERNGRKVKPFTLVEQLDRGEAGPEEFRKHVS